MFVEFSRTRTVGGTIRYMLGATNAKDQNISIVAAMEICVSFLKLEEYALTKSPTEKKEIAKAMGKEITEEFKHTMEKASSRVKNKAPYSGYISFAPKDVAKLYKLGQDLLPNSTNTDSQMNKILTKIFQEYLALLGLSRTQHLAVWHRGTNMIHLHFAISAIYADGKTIDNHFLARRSDKACALLEQKYGLESVHKKGAVIAETRKKEKPIKSIATTLAAIPSYHDDDYRPTKRQDERTKAVNDAILYIQQQLTQVTTFEAFARNLNEKNIKVTKSTKHKRQGLVYTINGEQFAAFTLDRKFTMAAVEKAITANAQKKQISASSVKSFSTMSSAFVPSAPTNKSHGSNVNAADNHEDLTDEETKAKRYKLHV